MSQPLNRRGFGKLLAAGVSAAAVLPAVAAPSPAGTRKSAPHSLIKPAALKPGDTIGLITPAGHVDEPRIAKSIKNLESLGFKIKEGRFIREVRGNYAGPVWQRLQDLHDMFADPEVKGIWCATGGSGAISLLPHLNYALMRKNPKVFVGYSDITALHLAIQRKAGLVTFHGPLGVSTFSEYSVRHLRAVLMEPQAEYVIQMAEENRFKAIETLNYDIRVLRPGVAQGRLTGGNLSLVAALAGTPYAAEIAGKLLFLEDINEPPYKVDRMMTQLNLAGDFNKTAGLMLGIFEKGESTDKDPSLTLAETIADQAMLLKVPYAYGYSFGHIRHQFTLPMGVMARMDTGANTLTLLEPAVRT